MKTLNVEDETWKECWDLKFTLGLANMNALIKRVLKEHAELAELKKESGKDAANE